MEARINALRDKLSRAMLIDPAQVPKDQVAFGATVRRERPASATRRRITLSAPAKKTTTRARSWSPARCRRACWARRSAKRRKSPCPRARCRCEFIEIRFEEAGESFAAARGNQVPSRNVSGTLRVPLSSRRHTECARLSIPRQHSSASAKRKLEGERRWQPITPSRSAGHGTHADGPGGRSVAVVGQHDRQVVDVRAGRRGSRRPAARAPSRKPSVAPPIVP